MGFTGNEPGDGKNQRKTHRYEAKPNEENFREIGHPPPDRVHGVKMIKSKNTEHTKRKNKANIGEMGLAKIQNASLSHKSCKRPPGGSRV